jgi:hypothetical protein
LPIIYEKINLNGWLRSGWFWRRWDTDGDTNRPVNYLFPALSKEWKAQFYLAARDAFFIISSLRTAKLPPKGHVIPVSLYQGGWLTMV